MRNRLLATGFDNNGFAGLAAITDDEKEMQIIISNYQVPDDVIQAVDASYTANGNTAVSSANPLNSEGLWNPEYVEFAAPALSALGLT